MARINKVESKKKIQANGQLPQCEPRISIHMSLQVQHECSPKRSTGESNSQKFANTAWAFAGITFDIIYIPGLEESSQFAESFVYSMGVRCSG